MPNTVLLVSDGLFHPSLPARIKLRSALDDGYFRILRASSLEQAAKEKDLNPTAVGLYIHHRRITAYALNWLDDFVRSGGGLLAIHSAAASFKLEPRFYEILGGRFSVHGPVEEFVVMPAREKDPIFPAAGSFKIRDERYLHEYDPGNAIHFYSQGTGNPEPFVWTREHGQGRVCYCAAGHTVSSMNSPDVQSILRSGLRWVTRCEAAE